MDTLKFTKLARQKSRRNVPQIQLSVNACLSKPVQKKVKPVDAFVVKKSLTQVSQRIQYIETKYCSLITDCDQELKKLTNEFQFLLQTIENLGLTDLHELAVERSRAPMGKEELNGTVLFFEDYFDVTRLFDYIQQQCLRLLRLMLIRETACQQNLVESFVKTLDSLDSSQNTWYKQALDKLMPCTGDAEAYGKKA
ncbi:hypothetical protein SJAG_05533 [Schizosaccharomyces japonicus yFS275]|uniref:Uncharacterized protein n=1 Tax=Schizosaccharomyces japonicus (strain yFS275 / FY16936) TaxID=402676 RepID=T0RSZ4_SCHJY|nr:hypothetical protein SJAG_05533 [Schizosaccharomyces japonicus yFS275]EQC53065.1 hypothetical protein SJAG_05533 [Schizosaccharomyces japonicus yFS275]